MVKKVIRNLDSSKAPGPDSIPDVVFKNCEPERSYILSELFNMCLKESCFPDGWKVLSVVPAFKNVGERLNWIALSNSTAGKCVPTQVVKQPEHARASTTEEQKSSPFQTNYDLRTRVSQYHYVIYPIHVT